MSIFDKAFSKRDDEYHKDYQQDIERMRREQEAHMKQTEYDRQRQMTNAAHNAAMQTAIQGNPYQQGTLGSGYQSGRNDPRGVVMNARSSTPSVEELYDNVKRANHNAKELMYRIDRTEKKVEMLTGFYTWITEVYPEIAAQHKAMHDLYEAANAPQQERGKQA